MGGIAGMRRLLSAASSRAGTDKPYGREAVDEFTSLKTGWVNYATSRGHSSPADAGGTHFPLRPATGAVTVVDPACLYGLPRHQQAQCFGRRLFARQGP